MAVRVFFRAKKAESKVDEAKANANTAMVEAKSEVAAIVEQAKANADAAIADNKAKKSWWRFW